MSKAIFQTLKQRALMSAACARALNNFNQTSYIHSAATLQFRATDVLGAEPMKAKRRIDPAVLAARLTIFFSIYLLNNFLLFIRKDLLIFNFVLFCFYDYLLAYLFLERRAKRDASKKR